MENDELFDPFSDDELFDDEYADQLNDSNDEYEDSDDEYKDSDDDQSTDNEFTVDESDAVTEYLRNRGIDARSIKVEDESGEMQEVDFNDLSQDEQLQILQDLGQNVNEDSEYDLSQDEIDLLNTIRRNGWTAKDYNNYIANAAIENYTKNNSQYSINNIADDELFLLDLDAKYPDISNEEKVEELEHAKQNPQLYQRKIETLRQEYVNREQMMLQQQAQMRQQLEENNMRDYVNSIVKSINDHRYMDIGLGSDLIELSDQDMQDIYTTILGKDQAGNRYITNILNNADNLVEAVWYLSKGKYLGKDIQDYYRHLITQARQTAYKKGYDDAKAGRQISSKAVVSKRLSTPRKLEQTIYDLD